MGASPRGALVLPTNLPITLPPMSHTGIAQETLAIVARGAYTTASGARVDVSAAVGAAIAGTRLYRPSDFDALPSPKGPPDAPRPRFEVTGETTAAAARRLFADEGQRHVLALNFASARNPGGGFLGGAKAQEEDLCRCSALYSCQIEHRAYYDENRASGSMLYTDHLLYSPDVPFFRDERLSLLEAPFLVSIITSPAPNAGEAAHKGRGESARVRETLERRGEQILRVAAHHGHRTLVLGAWGCGVFRNDPRMVAEVFADWLAQPGYRAAFDRVVFAVYTRGKGEPNRKAFEARFGHG